MPTHPTPPASPGSPPVHPPGLNTAMELFDIDARVALLALAAGALMVVGSIFFFIRSAPPGTVTITAGPEGSGFYKNALKYAKVLERNGVKVKVLTSKGSLENLQRLADPASPADVGFVQVGMTGVGTDHLMSLGSISYQPLLVFYRGKTIELISELKDKKIAIGPPGSGTRTFALTLLAANGIAEKGPTPLLDWDAKEASEALLAKRIDAAFVMSESASTEILRTLMRSGDVHLFSFKQANAYSRKIDSLNVLELPQGAIDLGANIPTHDVSLLGPMVELVAVDDLHPAISDLLLEAATETHNRPGIFQKRGEFPSPIEHTLRISDDASRYYKSGKSLLYRWFPFWLASLISRIVVVFIPMLVVLIPAVRSVPAFFRWRIQRKIHRRYRELLTLEQELLGKQDVGTPGEVKDRLDRIADSVNKMKVPASFVDQLYSLRVHIDYVRQLH